MKGIVDSMARKSVRIYEEKKALLQRGEEETSKQIAEGKDILSLLSKSCSQRRWRVLSSLITILSAS